MLAAGCSGSGTGSDSQDARSLPEEQAAGATEPERAASDGTASEGTNPTDGEDGGGIGSDEESASEERPPSRLGALTFGLILETFPDVVHAHPMVAQMS